MVNVMLDLETLGNSNNAVIVSIGAVVFDTGGLKDEFYINIDPESCVAEGLALDASTVLWWLKQSEAARGAITSPARPPVSLRSALDQFSKWIPVDSRVWGNGATFDNVILENAYRATGLPAPWGYWNSLCYRTLKSIFWNVEYPVFEGVAHNALDDAKHQAKHAVAILRFIDG